MPIDLDILPLEELAGRLAEMGDVDINESVVKFKIENYKMFIYSGGRTIIHGTEDEKNAKMLFFKYVKPGDVK